MQRMNMVENHGLGEQNMEIPKAKTKNVTEINKCKQCNYQHIAVLYFSVTWIWKYQYQRDHLVGRLTNC